MRVLATDTSRSLLAGTLLYRASMLGTQEPIMVSPGDEARRLADEVKFRNMGGNLEGIQGFNLECALFTL